MTFITALGLSIRLSMFVLHETASGDWDVAQAPGSPGTGEGGDWRN